MDLVYFHRFIWIYLRELKFHSISETLFPIINTKCFFVIYYCFNSYDD